MAKRKDPAQAQWREIVASAEKVPVLEAEVTQLKAELEMLQSVKTAIALKEEWSALKKEQVVWRFASRDHVWELTFGYEGDGLAVILEWAGNREQVWISDELLRQIKEDVGKLVMLAECYRRWNEARNKAKAETGMWW